MKKLFIIAISFFALSAFAGLTNAEATNFHPNFTYATHNQVQHQNAFAAFGYGTGFGVQYSAEKGTSYGIAYGRHATAMTEFGQDQEIRNGVHLGYGGNTTNFRGVTFMSQYTKGKAKNYGSFGSKSTQFAGQGFYATRDWQARSMTTATGQLGFQHITGRTNGKAKVKSNESLGVYGDYDRVANHGNSYIHQWGGGYIDMYIKGKAKSGYCGRDSYDKRAFAAQGNITKTTNDGYARTMRSSQKTGAMYVGDGAVEMRQNHAYEQGVSTGNAYQHQWGQTETHIRSGHMPRP